MYRLILIALSLAVSPLAFSYGNATKSPEQQKNQMTLSEKASQQENKKPSDATKVKKANDSEKGKFFPVNGN